MHEQDATVCTAAIYSYKIGLSEAQCQMFQLISDTL